MLRCRRLEAQKDFNVIGEAQNGRELLGISREEEPDVVMFDVTMPQPNGMEIARRIAQERLVSRTVLLSSYTDRPLVEAAVKAGVHGFVHRTPNRQSQCGKSGTGEPILAHRWNVPGG